MEAKKLVQIKNIKSAIFEMWNLYKSTEVHYTNRRKIAEKFKTSLAIDTAIKRIGLGESKRRGYMSFLRAPREGDAEQIYAKLCDMSKACWAKRNDELKKFRQEQSAPPHFTKRPFNQDRRAILY